MESITLLIFVFSAYFFFCEILLYYLQTRISYYLFLTVSFVHIFKKGNINKNETIITSS